MATVGVLEAWRRPGHRFAGATQVPYEVVVASAPLAQYTS
ncbi:hypothetical protein X011_08440 [Mycobacterium tuberculosis variant microti OV254]|nr:hypothetical protein X011_08440 [Mycobacterium tuberculosis variant microti OV254]